jgi:cellulase/cellobiase CelA1
MKLADRRSWLAGGVAAAVVAAGMSVVATSSAQAAAGCQVAYSVSSQWQGGFGANVTVTNLGSPLNTWTLAWSFAPGQAITQLWNGSYTQSGTNITVTNASYNGTIPTGMATVNFTDWSQAGSASLTYLDQTPPGADVLSPARTPT